MKPTEQEIKEAAKSEYREFPTEVAGSMNYNKDVHCFKKRKAYEKGANWAISQMQPEWVACSEKLPEKHKWVITSEIIKGLSEPTIFIASFEGDRWRNFGGSTPENITHWMPLPQPPTK